MPKNSMALPTGLPVSTKNNGLADGATKVAPIEPQGFLSQPVAPGTARNIETGCHTPSPSEEAEDFAGRVQWHSSEEHGGPDVGLLLTMPDGGHLWAGEISRNEWESDPENSECGSDFGFWLIQYKKGGGKVVFGKFVSPFAAQDFIDEIAALVRALPSPSHQGGNGNG